MPHNQPLNAHTVTQGSVLVLRAYPAAFTLVGLVLLVQSPPRTSSAAFDSARWVLSWTPAPIRSWALVFLAIGVAEAMAWWLERRSLFKWLLVAGAGVCGFWSTLLLCSAATDPFVSFTGAIWVGLAAVCHMASIRSLARDVVLR